MPSSRQTSTTDSDGPMDITPACCCTCYFSTISFFFIVYLFSVWITRLYQNCYAELFVNSVSISNANVSAADWRVGFVARSPVTGCKVSIHALNPRLLRGVEVISTSSSPSSSYLVKGDKRDVVFEKVVMPEVIGDVIWNIRVEIMFAFNIDSDKDLNGFMVAVCPAISVKFTTDPTGKVMGSLLGNVRRCDYIFRPHLA